MSSFVHACVHMGMCVCAPVSACLQAAVTDMRCSHCLAFLCCWDSDLGPSCLHGEHCAA